MGRDPMMPDLRPRLIVMVGLPGSGKSTYIRSAGGTPISSDDLRQLLIDNPHDQTIHRQTFALLRRIVAARARLRRPVTYVDATNLMAWERRSYIRLAELYDCCAEAIFLDVPLDICKQRNRERCLRVPDHVMDQLAARLVPPTADEGFARVTTIR